MLSESYVLLTEDAEEWIEANVDDYTGLLCCCLWHCRTHNDELSRMVESPATTPASLFRLLPPIGKDGPATVEPDTAGDLLNTALDELLEGGPSQRQVLQDIQVRDFITNSVMDFLNDYSESAKREIAAAYGLSWKLSPAPAGPVLPFPPDSEPVKPGDGIPIMVDSLEDTSGVNASGLWEALEQDALQAGLEFPTRLMVARKLVEIGQWPADGNGDPVGIGAVC